MELSDSIDKVGLEVIKNETCWKSMISSKYGMKEGGWNQKEVQGTTIWKMIRS